MMIFNNKESRVSSTELQQFEAWWFDDFVIIMSIFVTMSLSQYEYSLLAKTERY